MRRTHNLLGSFYFNDNQSEGIYNSRVEQSTCSKIGKVLRDEAFDIHPVNLVIVRD